MDAPRKLLVDTWRGGPISTSRTCRWRSAAIMPHLQQYLMRGSPRELPRIGAAWACPAARRVAGRPALDGAACRWRGGRRAPRLALRADRADLPVYASAEGGGGAIIITNEPIDYVRRPEPLLSVRDGYGCYVIGDSMSPAYEQGDLLLIHPGRPVRPGDDCVFVRDPGDGSQHALVKRLLRITPEKWRVRQFNPAKDFDLDRGQWQKAQLIVGKFAR